MGISTPKPRFDLAAFLAEKAPAKSRRKPSWSRPTSRADSGDGIDEAREDGSATLPEEVAVTPAKDG